MKEWKTYRLGDLIKISSGFPYKGEYIGRGENYILGMGCVSFKETFLHSGLRAYSDEAPDRYIAKPGEIVLATRQQSDNLPILGMPAIIPHIYEGRKMIIGANLYKVLNESNFTNEYIYWLMKSPAYIHHIRSCQTGTTVRMITKANIEDFTFNAPEEHERKRISDFLWNLENKIQLNRQINDNLKQQAQALYKSWFVDFEPFKDQEFVDSEIGLIPENWNCTTLSEFISIKYGKDHKKLADGIIPVFGSGGLMRYVDTKLHEGESVLIPRKGSLNNVMYVNEAFWTVDTMFYSTPKVENSCIYAYLFLANKDLASMNAGSAVPSMTTDILNNMPIIAPPTEVLKQFNNICNVYFSRIHQNNIENANLAKQRDTLLPKLMSGELKINETDC